MVDTNALGDRGESLFFSTVTKFHGDKPLFRPSSLGAKWPVADFVVEVVDHPGKFFLVQVKATQRPVTRAKRIWASASKARIQLLLSAPVPVFLAAVDEPNERVFIVRPAKPKHIRSVGTKFCLNDPGVRTKLKEEVISFWAKAKSSVIRYRSVFLD